ncbi:MAG: sortase [Peptoniphilaceae bacterium]
MTKKRIRSLGLVFILLGLALWIYNLYEGQRAYAFSQEIVDEFDKLNLEEKPLGPEEDGFPIPKVNIDGVEIIGELEIPKLGKRLPITASWNYKLMKRYPNRYMGERYGDPLIIMAHNYKKHFNDIYKLEKGDEIKFTDVLGRVINYEVEIREVIDGYDVESMTKTNYDLSLFTCTIDSMSRITIRANRI